MLFLRKMFKFIVFKYQTKSAFGVSSPNFHSYDQ